MKAYTCIHVCTLTAFVRHTYFFSCTCSDTTQDKDIFTCGYHNHMQTYLYRSKHCCVIVIDMCVVCTVVAFHHVISIVRANLFKD